MTDYFVSQAGSDGALGTSQGAAWKNISKVNSSTFAAGDRIFFNRGDRWSDATLLFPSAGAVGNPITIDAYGSGALPQITAAPPITAGWTLHSGNIWKVTATVQPLQVWFNGTRGTGVASIAAIVSANQWFWSSNVLYVFSTSNPSTAFTTPGVTAPVRNYTIDTNSKSYLTFKNLDVRGGNDGGLYIHGSHHVVVDTCDCQDNVNYGILSYAAVATDIHHETVQFCNLFNNGRWGYSDGFGSSAGGGFNIVTYSNVYLNGWRTGAGATGGILGDFSGGSISHNLIYSNGLGDPVGNNLNHGIYIVSNSMPNGAVTIEWNITHDNRAFGCQSKSNATVRYNISYNNGKGGFIFGEATSTTTINCYYNLSYNNSGRGIDYGLFGGVSLTLNLYNNTVYNNTISCFHIADSVPGCAIRNNIFYAPSGTRTYEINPQLTTGVFTKNTLFRVGGGSHIGYNTGVSGDRTFASWVALGFETGSQEADPLFTNAASADFTLQSGSPARDFGGNLSLTPDLAGNTVPNGALPDGGAYEYITVVTSKVPNIFNQLQQQGIA